MRIKSIVALAIAAVVLLFVAGWTSKAEQASRNNWEYTAVTVFHHPEIMQPNMKELNDLGDEGWEMVTAVTAEVTRANTRQIKLTCYFKRPR
jgi:hypothetical protein